MVQQLSLWDNEALETGYHCLATLDLEEAKLKFKEALQSGIGEKEHIQNLIAGCEYWQTHLQQESGFVTHSNSTESHSEYIAGLLSNYIHFHFTPQMARFKKAILVHITGFMHAVEDMDLKNIETAFDLLLETGDFQKAEDFISEYLSYFSRRQLLLYYLPQAQWLNGNRSEANNNYAWLLLHHPDHTLINRIENKKLKEIIESVGPAMAPAYGWLRKVLSFVSLSDEIPACDEKHEKALQIYHLLGEANKSLQNNDMKSGIHYRKLLKILSPELYEEYFNWLKQ